MAAQNVLLTDLHQLTTLEAYRAEGMNGGATFEFFVCTMPAGRGFLVAAGPPTLRLPDDAPPGPGRPGLARASGHFDAGFVDSLSYLTFTGDVRRDAEGTRSSPTSPSRASPRSPRQAEPAKAVRSTFRTLDARREQGGTLRARGPRTRAGRLRTASRARGRSRSPVGTGDVPRGFAGTATVEAGRHSASRSSARWRLLVQAHADEASAFEA